MLDVLKINNRQIEFNKEETQNYNSLYNEPCSCDSCQNFRSYFRSFYPKTNEFLDRFGLSLDRALEIMDFGLGEGSKNKTSYRAYFCLKGDFAGSIINFLNDENVNISLYNQENLDECLYTNTDMERPYFILELGDIYI